ncbi:MAG: carbamoyl phosphate synthase, partial [Clostridiales bacterium]|nr:carbamoyl phosphate synthase [Clostridiales bacterium]
MTMQKFKRVMAANRGEIAIRIFRAINELDITTIGVFSQEDKDSLFRTKADEAYSLNAAKGPIGAYLDMEELIHICKLHDVDAIHPGYGFLSENPRFVQLCEEN